MIDFKTLSAPFDPARVSWRVGSTTGDKSRGMALAYIDARDVMERLDEVCGPAGWQCRYSHANGKTVCDLGVRCGDEWVWKADGAGDTDYEAEKGALSDAFKRAAVRWGIGRYLYDLKSPWVEIEAKGKSFVIKESGHAALMKLLDDHFRRTTGATPHPTPSATPEKKQPARIAKEFADSAIEAIRKATKQADLTAWANGVSPRLDRLKEAYPADFKRVDDAYNARWTELKNLALVA